MKKITYQNKLHFKRRSKYQQKRQGLKRRYYSISANQSFQSIKIDCPQFFLLQSEYCEAVLECIKKVKNNAAQGNSININMKSIKEIGEGAISMLLSVLEEVSKRRVNIYGSMPSDPIAKQVLVKSGFLKYVTTSDNQPKETKNTILKTGDYNTNQAMLKPEIRKAMNTVWGVSGRNPIVYGCVFEMIRNSCDHAFASQSQIRWHWSISHQEKEQMVKFSFVDNGTGLIKTFKNGPLNLVRHFFTDNIDLVETAFKDGIESRTGLPWRGKGLPTIFEAYTDNYIQNLVIITNNVFIDFDKGVKKILNINFSGTYYYWVVNPNCTKACFL